MDACAEAARYADESMTNGDRERSIRAVTALLALSEMSVDLLKRRKRAGDRMAQSVLDNLEPNIPGYQLALNRLRRGKIELALNGTRGRAN